MLRGETPVLFARASLSVTPPQGTVATLLLSRPHGPNDSGGEKELNDHFVVPDDVRANVIHVFGDAGRDWLQQLPRAAGELVARWQLSPRGRAYGGCTHALGLPATSTNGVDAFPKIPAADDENRLEAAALRCYCGHGAVQLYGADAASGALLLERAEPGTPLADHPDR